MQKNTNSINTANCAYKSVVPTQEKIEKCGSFQG